MKKPELEHGTEIPPAKDCGSKNPHKGHAWYDAKGRRQVCMGKAAPVPQPGDDDGPTA